MPVSTEHVSVTVYRSTSFNKGKFVTIIAPPTTNNGAIRSTSLQVTPPRFHQCQMSSAADSVTDLDSRPPT